MLPLRRGSIINTYAASIFAAQGRPSHRLLTVQRWGKNSHIIFVEPAARGLSERRRVFYANEFNVDSRDECIHFLCGFAATSRLFLPLFARHAGAAITAGYLMGTHESFNLIDFFAKCSRASNRLRVS